MTDEWDLSENYCPNCIVVRLAIRDDGTEKCLECGYRREDNA